MDEQQLADTPATEPAELSQDAAIEKLGNILEPSADTPEQAEAAETPEPQAEATESEADTPEPTYKVKVDGQEVEVPLSELLKGYSRQSDYSKKTEAVSKERQELQQQKQTVEQQRSQYEQGLQQTAAFLQVQLKQFEGVDWQKLADTDPIGYLQAKERQREIRDALQGTQQQAAQLYQQKVSERHQAFRQILETETEKVLNAIPEWKDEAKATSEKNALIDYLTAQGFQPQELFPQTDPRTGDIVSPGLIDHRQLLIARKAHLYDQMVAKANAAAKKVTPLPTKVQRAGTDGEQMSDRELTLRRFNKSGSTQDAIAAIAARLG